MLVRSMLLLLMLTFTGLAMTACGGDGDGGSGDSGSTSASQAAPFPSLNTIDDLKTRFNTDGGIRLILLLTPTCKTCIDAIRYIEREILAKHPEGKVNVYAIWTAALPDDNISALDATHFTDSRVAQFWDASGEVGRWFPMHEWGPVQKVSGPVAYDAFFLFGSDAMWGEFPDPLSSFGGGGTTMSTIMRARGDLNRDLSRLLTEE